MEKKYNLGDTVIMKKPHACGGNQWTVIRTGADVKIKCLTCGHAVMMDGKDFAKRLKDVKTQR